MSTTKGKLGRPNKQSLDYFPLEISFEEEENEKLSFIEARYGLVGFAIYIKLLQEIYKNSYYFLCDERALFLFSKQCAADANIVKSIINDCIDEELFNKELYEKYEVLTSDSIQEQYLTLCHRRKKIIMKKEYLLIDPSNFKNVVIE